MAHVLYEKAFIERINKIHGEGFSNISNIESFPTDAAWAILREVLEMGCLCQNVANIEIAREFILKIPEHWLMNHIADVAKKYLFLEPDWQEWEFCRLAEMLEGHFPNVFLWLVDYAKQLNNPEVDEAIADFI